MEILNKILYLIKIKISFIVKFFSFFIYSQFIHTEFAGCFLKKFTLY